jgi:hypothetical protein
MPRQPIHPGAIALAFVPGEGVVDLVERLHLDRSRPPDRARPVAAVKNDDMTADPRHRLATLLDIAQQAGRGPLWTLEDQREQLVGEFRTISHATDIVGLLGHASCAAVRLPERFDIGRTWPVHRATLSENRQTRNAPAGWMTFHTTEHPMATLRKQIALDAGAATAWHALRDFGAVHTRVAPGFVVKLEMDKGDRIVTFFNGMVARERLVTLDDEECRLVYAVVEGRASHYNAAVQVLPEGDGRSRLVWTVDLLPDELAPAIKAMMNHAAGFMKKTLDAA